MTSDEKSVAESYLYGRRGSVVQVRQGESVPQGAILINSDMVAQIKHKALFNLPTSQSWAYKFGAYVVAGTSWLSGAIVAYTFRRRLKMFGVAGRFLTYGPAVFGPSVIVGLIQEIYKQEVLLVAEEKACPVCLPIQSACTNVVTGWLIPSVIGAMTAAHLARINNTYPVPRLSEPKALIQSLEAKNVVLEKTIPLEERITTKSTNWGAGTGVR